jgi:hypothetical protein
VNITQISATLNVKYWRGATSRFATAQLAVVDGRSIYQSFRVHDVGVHAVQPR